MQNQQKIEWPRRLVVAKAYLDQLERSRGLAAGQIAALRDGIQKAESSNMNKKDVSALKKLAAPLGKSPAKSDADGAKTKALAAILNSPER